MMEAHDDYSSSAGWVDPFGNLQQQPHPHTQQPLSPHDLQSSFSPHPHHPQHHHAQQQYFTVDPNLHQHAYGQQQQYLTGHHWPPVSHYGPVPQTLAPATATLAPAPTLMSPATHTGSTSSTPRRTLTDADRRRMCLFHEENPTVKQTEIGAMFGVERSTVSKVLRQKEKYLFPDDGSRSPVKRSKGKFPDIERALSVWAKNTRKQGIPLSDNMIREKARFFAISVGISESHFKANSGSWLEKFKQKNNLHANGRGRSESDVTGISRGSVADRLAAARGVGGKRAPEHSKDSSAAGELMQHSNSQDSHNTSTDGSSDSALFDSLNTSATSGTSTYGDAGPASPASPFFNPDSGLSSALPSPGFHSRMGSMSSQANRPRSQTFPTMLLDPSLLSPPPSNEPLTPKIMSNSLIQSPLGEFSNPLATPGSSIGSMEPTKDEARRAMEVVIEFLRRQGPIGGLKLEPDETKVVEKIMGKFQISDPSEGMGRIDERDEEDAEMEFEGDSEGMKQEN